MRISSIEQKVRETTSLKFPYTNVIGLSRSVIALGTLLTLLTNSSSVLIQKTSDEILINPLLNPVVPLNKFNFFLLLGIDNFVYAKILAIIILSLVISGYFIKITALLHWWISVSFFFCSSVIDGGDQIAMVLSFLLIPLCLTDRRRNHWQTITPYHSTTNILGLFSIYIIRIQVAVIYFHAAVGKFRVEEWSNGTALYYWLNHSFFGTSDNLIPILNSFLGIDWTVTLLTYGVLVFEILLFLGLTASNKFRKTLLIPALMFHFSIIVFHGIFSFFFSIAGGLILYLYPTYQPINFKLWFQSK